MPLPLHRLGESNPQPRPSRPPADLGPPPREDPAGEAPTGVGSAARAGWPTRPGRALDGRQVRQDATSQPLVRLQAEAPGRLVQTVSDEVTRRRREGRGDRVDLALEIVGQLPFDYRRAHRVAQVIDAAGEWLTLPRTRRLVFRVPPVVRDHLDNLLSHLNAEGDHTYDRTDLLIAATVTIVDPDAPPLSSTPEMSAALAALLGRAGELAEREERDGPLPAAEDRADVGTPDVVGTAVGHGPPSSPVGDVADERDGGEGWLAPRPR